VTLLPEQFVYLSNSDQTAIGLLAILSLGEESMNADQLKGKWMQVKGDLKQQWGKFTNDDVQKIEGSFDKILGQLQERCGGHCVSLVRGRYGEKKDGFLK
jgi:uncharacterized protein YjbJ (UPF0337 family)